MPHVMQSLGFPVKRTVCISSSLHAAQGNSVSMSTEMAVPRRLWSSDPPAIIGPPIKETSVTLDPPAPAPAPLRFTAHGDNFTTQSLGQRLLTKGTSFLPRAPEGGGGLRKRRADFIWAACCWACIAVNREALCAVLFCQ